MEFYLDIFYAFTMPRENILQIYMRAKFMLTVKVSIVIPRHGIVD